MAEIDRLHLRLEELRACRLKDEVAEGEAFAQAQTVEDEINQLGEAKRNGDDEITDLNEAMQGRQYRGQGWGGIIL